MILILVRTVTPSLSRLWVLNVCIVRLNILLSPGIALIFLKSTISVSIRSLWLVWSSIHVRKLLSSVFLIVYESTVFCFYTSLRTMEVFTGNCFILLCLHLGVGLILELGSKLVGWRRAHPVDHWSVYLGYNRLHREIRWWRLCSNWLIPQLFVE